MFSLPQGDLVAEGRSEDKPIVLLGDTPEEFRHFLWALYALFVRLHHISIHDQFRIILIDHRSSRTSPLRMLISYILSTSPE